MAKYETVGGGSFGVYKKHAPKWPDIVGAIVVALVVIAILDNT